MANEVISQVLPTKVLKKMEITAGRPRFQMTSKFYLHNGLLLIIKLIPPGDLWVNYYATQTRNFYTVVISNDQGLYISNLESLVPWEKKLDVFEFLEIPDVK